MPGQYMYNPWTEASGLPHAAGDSMARIAMAQQLGRYRAQQMMAQQAYRQAQLGMGQERMDQQQPLIDARTAMATANAMKARMSMDAAQRVGDARQNRFVNPIYEGQGPTQEGAVRMARGNEEAALAQAAAMSPASAERMLAPMQVQPNRTVLNPISGDELYRSGPPDMSPYQQGQLDISSQRRDDNLHRYQETSDIAKNRLRIEAAKAFAQATHNRYGGPQQISPQMTNMFSGMMNGPAQQPTAMPTQTAPMTATNPQTKERILSLDGGQTWQPAQ